MRILVLSNPSFRYLEKSFEEWLDVQGYAPSTVYRLPPHVRELLHYFEQQGLKSIREVKARHIEQYYQQLRERANKRRGGGLSNSHLNKHIQAIRKFTEYLRKMGRLEISCPALGNEATASSIAYLTVEQIRLLVEATHQTPNHKVSMSVERFEALQARDRAMLAVYYGCGLRRNEGVNLDVGDILFDQSLLHVRKGKNHKERLVPISKTNRQYLIEYVYDHRPELSQGSKEPALFLSYKRPKRLGGQSLALRLKYLIYQTGDPELMQKEVALHTLRHSIATHLLQAGMKLESIARFLGHDSLESTQIYTHLSGVRAKREQPFEQMQPFEYGGLSEDERGL